MGSDHRKPLMGEQAAAIATAVMPQYDGVGSAPSTAIDGAAAAAAAAAAVVVSVTPQYDDVGSASSKAIAAAAAAVPSKLGRTTK